MNDEMSQYEKLGVETDKGYIGEIFSENSENKYPGAWVNIGTDFWDPNYVMTMHGDGVGSMTLTRLFCYFATGDPSFLRGDIINAFEMNMDIAAAGFTDKIVAIDVVNINGHNIPKEEYLKAVNADVAEMLEIYSRNSFQIAEKRVKKLRFFGGETADLVDQTPSCILDAAFFSRMPREGVIKGNVQVNDVVFGLPSVGQAVWEKEFNYGLMSNGSTHSRSGFFHPDYGKQFPFLVSNHNPLKGPFQVDEYISELGTTAGKALTSPCRHVGLIIKLVLDKLKLTGGFDLLHGITLVTGGGLKKVINLGKGIRYDLELENRMIAPLFRVIQDVTKESWKNMLKSYNCGTCLQFIGSAEGGLLQAAVSSVAEKISIDWYKMGGCSATQRSDGKNEVIVTDPWGDEHYYDK